MNRRICRYNLEYLTLNKNYQVIQTHHSKLELLFLPYISPRVINRYFLRATYLFESLKSNICNTLRTNLCGSFVLLFSVFISIISIVAFSQQLTNFIFVACSTKSSLCFMIKSVSCFRLLSTYLGKSK